VVDLVYRADGTAFLAAARSRGADVVDGLEVLVGQGARALERWTGRSAPRSVMRRAVTVPGPAYEPHNRTH
jgi:shikimate dehydrogenase